ncbi:hypothetical protein BKA62DRAFT_389810 [Auriculariales sp. MPI-PUGE-AT-0066]|nr:hypothetical protein BKA62DRAFT_389810 [Auriculariales sp. MPI-PUGE-AT-0066]
MPKPAPPKEARRVLGDLPLSEYIPADAAHAGTKRHHSSPAKTPFMSPHKRRMLAVDGLISPNKTPLSRTHLEPNEAVFASPARRLDFAALSLRSVPPSPSKAMDTDDNPFSTPRPARSASGASGSRATKLAPSPELTLASCSSRAVSWVPRLSPSAPTARVLDFYASDEYHTSAHYPGFDVAIDVLQPAAHFPTPTRASSGLQSQDNQAAEELDGTKENVAPRRKVKKPKTSNPVVVKPPASPSKSSSRASTEGRRTMGPLFMSGSDPSGATVIRTPLASPQLLRRLALQVEVDENMDLDSPY